MNSQATRWLGRASARVDRPTGGTRQALALVDDHAPAPPTVGRYRVVAHLGRGGMGEVFLAEDAVLARRVAVKRLRAPLRDDPGHRARFRREARISARLDHRAIVRTLDLVCEGGVDHLILELVAGPSLRDLRDARPLGLDRIVELAAELVGALAHAHARGVVHRDLKLENVLIDDAGRPKLHDFGIAHCAAELELDDADDPPSPWHVAGTPRTMSPEQASGEPPDPRSDLFSFGVILYELIAGESPFAADGDAATILRVLHHRPRPLAELVPDLPRALSDLVEHLLEKAPALRPQDAREVIVHLRAIELATSA